MHKNELISLIDAKLESCKSAILHQWQNPIGTKTKHFVIDDLLPDVLCKEIYAAFPQKGIGFFSRKSFREKKKTSANLSEYAGILSDITYAFQDQTIVNKIADLIGYKKITPDPSLYAGGLSMMFQDDFLNPHIDNSHDVERKNYRRLNLLYYVTPDWLPENGGNFELWDETRTVPKTIVSTCNRLVVMDTNKTSWHSVSPVLVEGPRCCVSNYYFSKESPDLSDYFHVTSFSGRPEEKLKRMFAVFDNGLRNGVSRMFKIGRGKKLINIDSRTTDEY